MRAAIFPASRVLAAGSVLSVILSVAVSTGLDAQESRPMTVEDVLALRSLSQVSVSPDGQWVAYVVTERDMEEDRQETDVWIVPAAGGPGDARQLTFRPGSDDAPVWHPSAEWLAFSSDREGVRQVYGIRPDGGEAWQVTSHETSVGGFRFAPNGRRLGFVSSPPATATDRELEEVRGRPMVWDSVYTDQWSRLHVAELEDDVAGEGVRWSPDGLHVTSFVWSPDSRAVAFGARSSPVLRTTYYGATYVQEGAEAEARSVTSMPGGENPVAWDAESGLVVSGTGQLLGTFNRQLWRVPFGADGAAPEPVSLTAGLDANANLVHIDGSRLIVSAARRTGATVYRIPLADGAPAGPPSDLTDGRHYYSGTSMSADGRFLAFTAEDGMTSPDLFITPVDAFRPERLTDLNPQTADLALGEQRVESWPSRAGGEDIEGVLTLPVGYEEGDRVPMVLVIHGGPSGISSDRFNATRGAYPVQVYAGMGFAVLQPNYRGSSGYGERFRGLNRGDISGRDWVDIDSGVDAMVERGIADPDRLAVSGWSFGGHHTYWGITQTDRFRAASAGAGANDLISMYSQTDIPEFYHTYLGPKPWEDWDLYEERSAYRHVENVTTPLLIQVGERDERVPAEQSIQFFEAVRAIGKAPTTLVLYPDQPHGVRSPRLQRDLMSRNVEWLKRWVLEPEALVP
ncbi:MAG: S9 family peptidase [Gemmatimonadetes bacterium]|nr:S9 family peptidase [Candidatus Palauibacter rhopaloidicola]